MWMDLESIVFSEISQKDKYYETICQQQNLKNKTNKSIKQNRYQLTDIKKKLIVLERFSGGKGRKGKGRDRMVVWN